jgi:ABC-2 type transport system ATP-binding protein
LGLSREEVDQKLQSIIDFSEVGRFIDQKVKNYSSGMRSRLAFSVAVHADREILLMDEVMAVGDVRFQEKCLKTFENFRKKKKTIILVSHSPATIKKSCDRAMVLDQGVIKSIGKPEKVMKDYKELMKE